MRALVATLPLALAACSGPAGPAREGGLATVGPGMTTVQVVQAVGKPPLRKEYAQRHPLCRDGEAYEAWRYPERLIEFCDSSVRQVGR